MKECIIYYVMPDEKEKDVAEAVYGAGLDGIERMTYGTAPAYNPFPHLTIGAHLRFWPYWVDFCQGNEERYRLQFPDKKSLIAYYGASTPEGWIDTIRKNVRSALAENPEYIVWHIADCRIDEAWTEDYYHSSKEVLRESARIYSAIYKDIPEHVYVLFENVFWPGLRDMLPEEVDYFFSILPGRNTGIMLDTGHYMSACPFLKSEEEGADQLCRMVKNLGSLKSLIKGMHLSCSLPGEYRRTMPRALPDPINMEIIMKHITSLDQHRPFRTHALRRMVDAVNPQYITHELFSPTGGLPENALRIQRKALGK